MKSWRVDNFSKERVCRKCFKPFMARGSQLTCYPCRDREKKFRTCAKCNIEKDMRQFFIRTRKYNWKNRDEVTHFKEHSKKCRKCTNEFKRNRYHERKDIIAKLSRENYQRRKKDADFILKRIKHSAKSRKLNFDLDINFIEKLRNKPCKYCGVLPIKGYFLGIDRVDSKLGYLKINSVPCCELCNKLKLTMNVWDFINHCKKVYYYNRSK